MSLPKIPHPISTITIPSTDKKVRFRPFLFKEEKILLNAQQSGKYEDIVMAIKQIVNNCDIESILDIDNITIFDLEYLYIKLYSLSLKNIINLEYFDREEQEALEFIKECPKKDETEITNLLNKQFNCNLDTYKKVIIKPYKFTLNLDDIKVSFPEGIPNKIKINDNSGIILRYPKSTVNELYIRNAASKAVLIDTLIKSCLDKYYIDSELYNFNDSTEEEKDEFINNLPIKIAKEIEEFLKNLPKISHTFYYKNTLNHERKIILEKLEDFFS